MNQNSNDNATMENYVEKRLGTSHNFDSLKNITHELTEPMAKEMFMATLGLSKLSNTSDTQSSSSSSSNSNSNSNGLTLSSRQARRTVRDDRSHPYGVPHHRDRVEQTPLITGRETLEQQQQPREEPLHKMIRWLMDLPQRCHLSRLSLSALRCNECHLCEGVEYPCTRCGQQFHQECHPDQGRQKPHRLCPSCTRNNATLLD